VSTSRRSAGALTKLLSLTEPPNSTCYSATPHAAATLYQLCQPTKGLDPTKSNGKVSCVLPCFRAGGQWQTRCQATDTACVEHHHDPRAEFSPNGDACRLGSYDAEVVTAQIFRYKAGKARRVVTLPIKAQAIAAVATVPSR